MAFLSFEDAGLFKDRKFQCFVCGKNFDSLEAMNEHIPEQHEQGREYIKCPVCGYCVRCMKTHFKVKHPKRALPKNVQMRVAIWKDFRPAKDGKTKTTVRKPGFRKGDFISQKCGRKFTYKSGKEEELLNLLEEDVDVENFYYEPIKVPYFWKGEWHNYLPDMRVNFVDGTTQIWEYKPANQTGPEYEQNQLKWAAANNFCTNLGWEFVLITEVGLGKLKAKISHQREARLRATPPNSSSPAHESPQTILEESESGTS